MLQADKVMRLRRSSLRDRSKKVPPLKSSENKRLFSVRFSFTQGLDFIKEINSDLDLISQGIDNLCNTPESTSQNPLTRWKTMDNDTYKFKLKQKAVIVEVRRPKKERKHITMR